MGNCLEYSAGIFRMFLHEFLFFTDQVVILAWCLQSYSKVHIGEVLECVFLLICFVLVWILFWFCSHRNSVSRFILVCVCSFLVISTECLKKTTLTVIFASVSLLRRFLRLLLLLCILHLYLSRFNLLHEPKPWTRRCFGRGRVTRKVICMEMFL